MRRVTVDEVVKTHVGEELAGADLGLQPPAPHPQSKTPLEAKREGKIRGKVKERVEMEEAHSKPASTVGTI